MQLQTCQSFNHRYVYECAIIKDMQKNSLKKGLIIFLSFALVISFIILDAIMIEPSRITVRRENLESEKIPEALDGMEICYFSDLDYGLYVDEKRLDTIVSKINNLGPDVVIFGGDLYDDSITPDETGNAILAKELAKIKAPYGKFAVYGDHDDASSELQNATDSIYSASGFEVLANVSISLHKKTSSSITLVGIGNGITGKCDIETAYSNVSSNNYVLSVCHTPDTADSVPLDLTDYFIAGHSHGGQVYYVLGALVTPQMAINHLHGKNVIQDAFTLDISDGVATTMKNIRFLTSNEIVMYRLTHTQTKEKSDS